MPWAMDKLGKVVSAPAMLASTRECPTRSRQSVTGVGNQAAAADTASVMQFEDKLVKVVGSFGRVPLRRP